MYRLRAKINGVKMEMKFAKVLELLQVLLDYESDAVIEYVYIDKMK